VQRGVAVKKNCSTGARAALRLTHTSVPGSRTTNRSRSPNAERNTSSSIRSGTTTSTTGVKPAFMRFVARAHRFSWQRVA
jgi:hypothetical protein